MILAMGLIALLTGLGFIFGPIAWIMGNSDLRDIRDGRMDPEGEGLVQTGRILGMVATILSIVSVIVFFGFFGCACCLPIIGAAGNNRNNFNRPPRRF